MARKGEAIAARMDRNQASGEPDYWTLLDRAWRKIFDAERGVHRLVETTMFGARRMRGPDGRTRVLRLLKMQIAKLDETRGLLIAAGRTLDKNFRP